MRTPSGLVQKRICWVSGGIAIVSKEARNLSATACRAREPAGRAERVGIIGAPSLQLPIPDERSVRGRRPPQGRLGPRRSRRVAAGRGRVRQAAQDQGGERAAALRLARRRASSCALAQRLAAELDAGFLWEVSGDAEFGFDELAREYYGNAPGPAQAAAVALHPRRVADALLPQGQGPLSQGAAGIAQGGAGVGRAQEARGGRGRPLGRGPCRASAARRAPRAVVDAALQAGQELARVEGARRAPATR